MASLSTRWRSNWERHDNLETAENDWCVRSLTGDRLCNYVLRGKMRSLTCRNPLFSSTLEKHQNQNQSRTRVGVNRRTELDVACVQLWEREDGAGTVQYAPNASVCCMNYQWEDVCALAELKRFRLRRPLTARWFDISIIDSKGDSDSWAAQSQLFSWFEASWTCTQVEGLVGDY